MEAYPSRTNRNAVVAFKRLWLQPFLDGNAKAMIVVVVVLLFIIL
jgi:hypothetical protein